MTDHTDRRISPPEPHRAADLSRAAGRAIAGAIPVVGSAATELVNLLPDPSADRRKEWEREVSDGVNDLHGRVGKLDEVAGARRVTLTGGAASAAMHMIKKCPDGLAQEWTSIEELSEAFTDLSKDELLDGLGELELHGLVKTISFIGSPSRYMLDTSAYAVLDPPIMGWDPTADAKVLARVVLSTRDTISVPDLDTNIGWPRRRLNPALRIVVGFVGEGKRIETVKMAATAGPDGCREQAFHVRHSPHRPRGLGRDLPVLAELRL